MSETKPENVKLKKVEDEVETAPVKEGWFTRLSNILRGRVGVIETAEELQATVEPPKPVEVQLYTFYVKVRHPKAGLVRFLVKAEDIEKAKFQAKVDYVRAISVVVEPFK